MRKDLNIVGANLTLAEMRSRHLAGSAKRTAVPDEAGRLLGLLDTSADPSADRNEPVGVHVTQAEVLIEREASLGRILGLLE